VEIHPEPEDEAKLGVAEVFPGGGAQIPEACAEARDGPAHVACAHPAGQDSGVHGNSPDLGQARRVIEKGFRPFGERRIGSA
jgi:hypothetical protein